MNANPLSVTRQSVLPTTYPHCIMGESIENPSCLLYGPGVAKFENRPYPVIEDQNDVIIRIAYVGVCGSDVSDPNHHVFTSTS